MEISKNQPHGNFHSHRPNYKHYPPRNYRKESEDNASQPRAKIISPPSAASNIAPINPMAPKTMRY